MKKIYPFYFYLITASTIMGVPASQEALVEQKEISQQKLLSMIVSFHNNAFGLDHLFDQPIENEKLIKWLEVGDLVKDYILENSTDLFGKQDTLLISSLNTIEKLNKTLVDSIITTYTIKDNTKNLIRMATLFQTIETIAAKVIKSLQNKSFIIKRKKNAQKVLLALALFIEATAKKANKDTRMGYRTDVSLPSTTATDLPIKKNIPLLPPTDLPPTYEEEPAEAPPTRPAPPIPRAL